MVKRYLQEYASFKDLIKQAHDYIYRVKYKEYYVYYTGHIIYPDLALLSFYRSDKEVSGWIGMDDKGEVIVRSTPRQGYIPIIEIAHSSFVEEMLSYYNAFIKHEGEKAGRED